jgi:phage gp46-like protein
MKDLSSTLLRSNELLNLDLTQENAIRNSIEISLLSDLQSEEPDRLSIRGYWADALPPEAPKLGSHIWMLERSRLNDDTLEDAIHFAYESLAWMKSLSGILDVQVNGALEKEGIVLQIRVECENQSYKWNISVQGGIHAVF